METDKNRLVYQNRELTPHIHANLIYDRSDNMDQWVRNLLINGVRKIVYPNSYIFNWKSICHHQIELKEYDAEIPLLGIQAGATLAHFHQGLCTRMLNVHYYM